MVGGQLDALAPWGSSPARAAAAQFTYALPVAWPGQALQLGAATGVRNLTTALSSAEARFSASYALCVFAWQQDGEGAVWVSGTAVGLGPLFASSGSGAAGAAAFNSNVAGLGAPGGALSPAALAANPLSALLTVGSLGGSLTPLGAPPSGGGAPSAAYSAAAYANASSARQLLSTSVFTALSSLAGSSVANSGGGGVGGGAEAGA